MSGSAVQDFFRGADVFVTGATGFVGNALLDKMLRSCPDVGDIYCLMRPKRKKDISERAQEFPKNLVFERLIEERGKDVFKKIIPVAGDVGEKDLGLSPEDRDRLKSRVQVVFHCAATLDFEANLKTTVNINLLGTRRIVELCSEMTMLKALVHVSSAYVNSNLSKQVDEVLYPPPDDVEKVIEMANTLADSALEEATEKILNGHPNTYTLTKALAEHEVAAGNKKFPAVILRPSMITCAWKEPVPGWTNSKNGPTGFFMGAAKGVVRRLPVGRNLVYDYIPVDVVVNEMLVAAWHTGTNRPAETPVYHLTSSTCNPFRWKTVESLIPRQLHSLPLRSAVWYPTLKLLPSLFLFRISCIFFHLIPAYILDTVTRMTGGRPILVRLHTNVNASLERLAPFIFQEWFFDNTKTLALHNAMSEKDKELFGIDIRSLLWESYFDKLAGGVRRYLNNEELKTLPAALKKQKILYVMNLAVQGLSLTFLWWLTSVITFQPMINLYFVPVLFGVIFNFL